MTLARLVGVSARSKLVMVSISFCWNDGRPEAEALSDPSIPLSQERLASRVSWKDSGVLLSLYSALMNTKAAMSQLRPSESVQITQPVVDSTQS